MTDNAPTTDDQPHPFDPDVPKRIGAYLDILAEVVPDHDLIACLYDSSDAEYPLTASDLRGLLERDAYAEKTRLQLAEGSHKLRGQLDVARAERTAAAGRVTAAEKALNNAYRERAQLVALLAAVYPSSWNFGDDAEPDWAIAYVQLPTGQATWHVHESDMDLFDHVQRDNATKWDSHSTEEKYQRVRALVAKLTDGKKA